MATTVNGINIPIPIARYLLIKVNVIPETKPTNA